MRAKKRSAAPFWWPDAQGLVISVIMLDVSIVLFYRMTHPAEINDKLLDMMITILFGTALVGIINYLIGSSRGSTIKDEANSRVLEKLTSPPPNGPVAPVTPIAPPTIVVAWWSKIEPAERLGIEASSDQRVKDFIVASKLGKATPEDLAYLVTAGLLKPERPAEIQST